MKMEKNDKIKAGLALCALSLTLCACSGSDISKSSQVLARVGDKEITSVYFERQLAELPESIREFSSRGEGKRAALDGLVNREILYAQALKKHVDDDAELTRKLDDLKKELIIKAYLQKEIAGKISVDDREIENFYNQNPDEYRHREEIRISQIVVPDQAKAAEIMEKLSIKRDFGELAANHSTDKASAAHKGDVGWFTMKKLPPEIRDSVFKLSAGEVSKPFKMGESFEIYKVTDRRSTSFELDKVKETIRMQIAAEKSQKEIKTLVDGLKKSVVVQLNEQLLK